jgi:subtilisin-like proprotein convertase family protein
MNAGKLRRIAGATMAVALVGCVAMAPAAHAGKKAKKSKNVTKTYTKGVGGSLGGVQTTIPDGGGTNTQVVRSAIPVKGLNPKGKITDVNVGVRATHSQATDLEFYLATPRGVINLSSDNGGAGNNYGAGTASCVGQFTLFDSNNPTLISTPALQAPFAGTFAPEESLNLLNGLGNKKATNATWTLLAEDDSNANPAGTLDCFKLTITSTSPKSKKK